MPALSIMQVTVVADRLVCQVQVAPEAPRNTTPQLAQRLCAQFPTLPVHACVNDQGDTFGAVMDCTPLPHLLEHLTIDLQVRALLGGAAASAEDPVFVGTTEWVDEAAGTARVEVSFTDDLVALRALCDAARILNEAMVS